MEVLLAVVVGGLYAGGIYMILRRSIVKLIIGIGLLGHAANLLIFTVGRVTRGRPPVIGEDALCRSLTSGPDLDSNRHRLWRAGFCHRSGEESFPDCGHG